MDNNHNNGNQYSKILQSTEFEELIGLVLPLLTDYIKQSETRIANVTNNLLPQNLFINLNLTTPDHGLSKSELYKVIQKVLNQSVKTYHPGFLDKLYASSTPIGAISELILGIINNNSHTYKSSPVMTLIELYMASEIATLFGYSNKHKGGLTFPGGSAANMNALLVARNTLYPDIPQKGYNIAVNLIVFTSSHGHYSIIKAACALGLGKNNVVLVKCDLEGHMILKDLETKIQQCVMKGFKPFFINCCCGSTVLGAFDNFEKIADIASRYNLWLHVDGCYGGSLVFSKYKNSLLKGIENSDSISINPHKLLGVPIQCSFLILKDMRLLHKSNSNKGIEANYLFHNNNGNNLDLGEYTIGCGRRPDAFKLFLTWQYYGTYKLGERVDLAMEKAIYLANKINNSKNFKLVCYPQSTNVCFWFIPYSNTSKNNPVILDETFVNDKIPSNTGLYTKLIHKKLVENGNFMVDYAPLTIYDYQTHNNSKDGISKEIILPEFFRVAINSPNVTLQLLDELTDEIESIGNKLILEN